MLCWQQTRNLRLSPNRSQCTCNAASDSLEIVPSEEEINQTFDRTMEEENQSTDTNILDGGLLAD